MQLTSDGLKKIQDVEKTAYPEHQWKFVNKSLDEVLAMPHFKNDDCFYMAEKNWYMIGRKYKNLIYIEDLAASYGAISSLDDFMNGVNFLKGFGSLPIYADSIDETSFPLLIAMERHDYISFLECRVTGHRHHQVCFVIEPCSEQLNPPNNMLPLESCMHVLNKDICFSKTMSSINIVRSSERPLFRGIEALLYGKENKALKMKNTRFKNKKMYIHELELNRSSLCRLSNADDVNKIKDEFNILCSSPKWERLYNSYSGLEWSNAISDEFINRIIPQNEYASYNGVLWSNKAVIKSKVIAIYHCDYQKVQFM